MDTALLGSGAADLARDKTTGSWSARLVYGCRKLCTSVSMAIKLVPTAYHHGLGIPGAIKSGESPIAGTFPARL